jgi:hypothetical protein
VILDLIDETELGGGGWGVPLLAQQRVQKAYLRRLARVRLTWHYAIFNLVRLSENLFS